MEKQSARRIILAAMAAALAGLTAPAAAAAQCAAEVTALQRLAEGVEVSFEAPAQVVAGEPIEVRWSSAAGIHDGGSEAWLMVVSVDAVRFAGAGFVPFPGGLPGPSDIAFAGEWMRAAVPLHLAHGSDRGSFRIKPFREGAFGLSWAVVAATSCGERQLTETRSFRTEVVSRRASIVVHDLYDHSRAGSAIETRNGRHRLLAFDGYFQVFDAATGAKILDRRGYCPDFSPTGRFVAALSDVAGGECSFFTAGRGMPKFEVVDLVSGKVVAQPDPPALWAHGDAFLFVPPKWWKLLQPPGHVLSLLVDPEDGAESAPLIEMHEMSTLRLALERGLLAVGGMEEDEDVGEVYNLLAGPGLPWAGEDDDEAESGRVETSVPGSAARLPAIEGALPGGIASLPSPVADPSFLVSHLRYIDDLPGVLEDFGDVQPLADRSPTHPLAADASVGIAQSSEDAGAMLAAGVARGAMSIAPGKRGGDRILELASALSGVGFEPSDPVSALGGDLWAHLFAVDAMEMDDDAKADAYHGRNEAIRAEIRRRVAADAPQAEAVFGQAMGCWPSGGRLGDNLAGAWRYASSGRVVWLTHAGCQGIGTVGNLATNQLDLFVSDAGGTRHYNLLFDAEFYPDALPPDEDDEDGEFVETPPVEEVEAGYGTLASAATGKPMKIEYAFHQLLEQRDLGPAFVGGRFIVLSVLDRLYVVDHRNLTLSGPVRLASSGKGATFAASRDGRHFMQVNDDGSLAIHRLDTGRPVLRGRYVDDEMALFDDAGHFVSTREGASYVHLRFEGRSQLYSLSQMAGALERPDMVRAALAGTARPASAPVLTAPPLLSVTLADDEAGDGRVPLAVRASSAAGLAQLRIFGDGALVEVLPLEGGRSAETVAVAVPAGTRWLTAVATDVEGAESRPLSLALGDRAGARDQGGGRLFAVAVGTDVYEGSAGLTPLKFAASDAKRFAEAVAGLGGGAYRQVEVAEPLLDTAGLEEKLDAVLGDLERRAGPGDTVMLFFAGHGLRGPDGRFYLATRDTALDRLETTGLSWSRLAARLSRLKGRVVVFLDACHSGGADDAVNDGAADALVDGAAGSVVVLAASKGRQFSFESAARGGGFFTAALAGIVAARGDPAIDRDGSGAVELDELYLALKREVSRDTDGRQTPWIARSQMVGKAPLF